MNSQQENPCVYKCIFDFDNHICSGCFRNLDDVWDWSKMSQSDKIKAIKNAKNNRRKYNNLKEVG
jgi:predicted Fe-S protein YdhL (DUF1289 family)